MNHMKYSFKEIRFDCKVEIPITIGRLMLYEGEWGFIKYIESDEGVYDPKSLRKLQGYLIALEKHKDLLFLKLDDLTEPTRVDFISLKKDVL